MKIVFLGTNGWYDTQTGNTVSVLVCSKDFVIVFDAGYGIHKLEDHLKDSNREVYLFLSHFHLDHIVGLHTLDKLKSCTKLYIAGPDNTKKILDQFVNIPFTMPFNKLKFETEIIELPDGKSKISFLIDCLPLKHSTLTLGYRIAVEDKIIAYCTDTGYCDNLVKLSKDADLLIAESAFLPGEEDHNWPHLNPAIAAKAALESHAKRLALMHFDAQRYKSMEDRKIAEIEARKYFQESFITKDDMELFL